MNDFSQRLETVKTKIASACARVGRDVESVQIIAVTKTHGVDAVRDAWEFGLSAVGENKVQEAMWKKENSISGPDWHLIGHLQTNKVRAALETFDFIQSVDSIKLASRIQTIAAEIGARVRILLEVNVSGEKSKSGMKPNEAIDVLNFIFTNCPNITVEGFMTMAPFSEDSEMARPYFKALRELRDHCEKETSSNLPHLSMGMSGDFEVAIEEGATMVRLGTILFGTREKITRARSCDDESCANEGLDSYSGAGPTIRVLD